MKQLTILALVFLSISNNVFSQANPFMTDANSRPLFMRSNYIADGSPYLFEEYQPAEVVLENGKSYSNIKARFNLVEKELVYLDDKGDEMLVTSPVRSILFYSSVNKDGVREEVKLSSPGKYLNSKENTTYIVLSDGKAKLLKQVTVTFSDEKKYGEATITRTFRRKETNFAYLPGKSPEFQKVEKNKSSIIAMFGDKTAEITSFIEKNQLKCKSDEDLVRIFQHYNSLG